MKYSCAILLLPISSVVAFQIPAARNIIGGAAAAAALVGAPLITPAVPEEVTTTPTTALVLDVTTDTSVADVAKSVFSHRGQIQQALKDFLNDAKQLEKDLDGVLPTPEVSLTAPSDVKQAARDALSGQARLVLNGNPVYFEVDSQEGFLTLKAVSPLIPKLPLLAPTAAEEASMVIPRTTTVYVKSSDPLPEVAQIAQNPPFWKWSFNIPTVNKEVTLPQAVGGAIAAAYGTAYAYHTTSNILNEREAEQKRKKNAAAAAAKKAKAKQAAKISDKMTEKVEGSMAKTIEAKEPTEVEAEASKVVSEESTKDIEGTTEESAGEKSGSKRNLLQRALRRTK